MFVGRREDPSEVVREDAREPDLDQVHVWHMRTTAVVFILPNDTKVWWQWKAAIPEQLHRGLDGFTRQEIRGTTSTPDWIRCDCSYVAADEANSRGLFAGGID